MAPDLRAPELADVLGRPACEDAEPEQNDRGAAQSAAFRGGTRGLQPENVDVGGLARATREDVPNPGRLSRGPPELPLQSDPEGLLRPPEGRRGRQGPPGLRPGSGRGRPRSGPRRGKPARGRRRGPAQGCRRGPVQTRPRGFPLAGGRGARKRPLRARLLGGRARRVEKRRNSG